MKWAVPWSLLRPEWAAGQAGEALGLEMGAGAGDTGLGHAELCSSERNTSCKDLLVEEGTIRGSPPPAWSWHWDG